jgi:hypothetical protein
MAEPIFVHRLYTPDRAAVGEAFERLGSLADLYGATPSAVVRCLDQARVVEILYPLVTFELDLEAGHLEMRGYKRVGDVPVCFCSRPRAGVLV